MPPIPRPGRFTVILAAIAILTIAAMTALLLWQLRVQELHHAESETISLSHILGEQTTRSLQTVDLALDLVVDRLAQAGTRIGADDLAIHGMLRSRIDGLPQLRSIFVADASGRVRSSALSHPAPDFSVADRDYFIALKDQPALERFFSAPTSNRVDNKRTVFISRRLKSPSGTFAGVVVASLDIAYIESFFNSVRLDRVGLVGLYLGDGTLIARASPDGKPGDRPPTLPARGPLEAGSAPVNTVREEGEAAGTTSFRRISGFPMVLGVGISDAEALAGWRDTARLILAGAGANILLMIAATIILLRRLRHEDVLAAMARERDNQLRAMVNSAMDAIVTIDGERRVTVFNPAAQKMFGYAEPDILGKPIDILIPERFRAEHAESIAGFRRSGANARMKDARLDVVGLRSDGTEFPIESTIARVGVESKEMFTAILRDIGDRRRAEIELRESHRQLRDLASSLQAVREEERTSIARELHDELGQQLLRLRMDLSWLTGRIRDLPPSVQDKVADMKQFIGGTVDTLRRVTTRLRPPLLDELGLADAAQWQIDDFAARSGIEIIARIDVDGDAIDERLSINAFRILQESLTNAARHSAASQVEVFLGTAGGNLVLTVRDNGIGADMENGQPPGHGLVGIRERVLLLGGTLEIDTLPGRGFALDIRIPLAVGSPMEGPP